MSEPTLAELIEQESNALRSAAAKPTAKTAKASSPTTAARRVSRQAPSVYNVDDEELNTGYTGAAVYGVADTLMIGHADEITTGLVSVLPDFLLEDKLKGKSRKQLLDIFRQERDANEEEYSNTYLAGQIAGGFVPVAGWGGRAAGAARAGNGLNVGRLAVEGAAYGAVYGYGSTDTEDYFDNERLIGAAEGAVFGAAGGFVFGTAIFHGGKIAKAGYQSAVSVARGKSPKIDFKFAPVGSRKPARADVAEDLADIAKRNPTKAADDIAEAATGSKPQAAINRLSGKASNELEDGAIVAADDILQLTNKQALLAKFTKLSPQQARVAAQKLRDAMESGDLTKEPHFKSILGLDLKEFGDEEKLIPEVADILSEMGEEVLERANMGTQTVKKMEADLRARYGDNISESQIDNLVEKVKETRGSANTGRLIMTLAGVKFARTTKDLMPEVMKGNRAARDELAEELSTALSVSAKGQFMLSEAGRNLGMLKHSKSILFKDVDGGAEVADKADITKRVKEAFENLDDGALNELLAQTRDLSNLEEISKVLLDARRAEQVTTWMRTRNTFEAFIKSNTLTPATAVINLVGVPIHNFVRNGGARTYARLTAEAAGNIPEALVLNMQSQAAKAVRWNAQMEGVKAAVRRIKWEALGSWKNIAGVAGFQKSALKASAGRQALIARGYRAPAIREFDLRKRLAVTDVDGFNQRLAERAASENPLASLVNGLERVGATALNVVDAAGTATAKIASGVIDDYGRAMVMTKEVYAEMAGAATQEAIRKGIPADKLGDYVSKRAKEWSTMPPEEILDAVEQRLLKGEDLDDIERMLVRRDTVAEKEAERVLFLDGAQTKVGRSFATVADAADTVVGLGQFKGILMPYISTPTRIIERGMVSYTPWGHLAKEAQEELAAGGVRAAMERARMEIGGSIMSAGMLLAAGGGVVVTNGADYKNSQNLGGAPANRLQWPDGTYVEFGRLEPLALGFAMGAIVGQMYLAAAQAGDKYGQDDAIQEAMSIGYAGFRDALLEKSYLTGLSDLFEAMTSTDEAAMQKYVQKTASDGVARVLPFSGTSRQIKETINGKSVEAISFMDRLAKVTPGMGGYLPARVDALGNEVKGRTMGIAAGNINENLNEVSQKVRELGIDITNLRKADPQGFDLTAEELSTLRTIRATEAVNSDGATMQEALSELFADPEFQALPDKDMVEDAVVKVMSQFNEPARLLFEDRNQQYLSDREAKRSLKLYIQDGLSNKDAQQAARKEILDLGLVDPTRVTE